MSHEKSCCKLEANHLASAAAVVMAVLYVICVVASAFWPEAFLNLMNKMVHAIDLTELAEGSPGPQITVGSFTAGLVQTVAYTYVLVYFFAWIYNKLLCAKPESGDASGSHGEGKSCCH